jgi:PAS domain S-box-containing protein
MTGADRSAGAAELWRWVADASPVGLAVVDRELRFTAVNGRMAEINAQPVEAHLGRRPTEVFPGAPGEKMEERFRHVLHSGEAVTGVRIPGTRSADGQDLTVVADYYPVRDDGGEVVAAACGIADVTERDRLERLLAAASEMMSSLVREAPVGVAFFDPDGRYVVVNDALAEINGVPAAAHVGRSVREVVPHLADEVEPVLARVLATGEPVVDVEVAGETAAQPGVRRQWLGTFYRVDTGAEVLGVGCVASEVTAERRAQRRLRNLIDGLFTFVGLCEPDGTLLEANRTALDAAGLTPDDVIGRPFWEAYWWSHDPAVQQRLREAVERGARGEASRYDAVVRVRDGRLITIDFQLVPIVEDGTVTALVPSGMDITDRQREAALVEATGALARELSTVATVADAVAVVLRSAGRALGADFVNLGLVEPGGEVRLYHPEDLALDIADRYQVVDLGSPSITAAAIRSGETQVLRHPDDHDGRFRDLYRDVTAAGLSCIAAVPLRRGGQPTGALGVGWAEDRLITPSEHARLDTVAKLCAQTLDRARRGDHQQEFLATLQAHLLPDPPEVPHLDVAVRYEPATDHLGFGGDWYDVAALDEDRTVVVVGDIVGHGIDAAARMSQVRGILMGLLQIGIGLDDLLARAARPLARLADGFLGTVAIAVVDTAWCTVDYACAGHPPPLLRHADGSVEVLGGGRHTVLGLATGTTPPGRADFPSGATLLLYSDGLVERRGEPLDDGIVRLVDTLAATRETDASGALGRITAAMLPGGRRGDDVAAVVVRHTT